MRRVWQIGGAILLMALVYVFVFLPARVESGMNQVLVKPPYNASARARELARQYPAVDLHADSLLWARDLSQRSTRGHVDIPRLIEANVALQAFTIVSKTPRSMNFQRNTGETDNILLLSIVERWPVATWRSLTERALYQASRLREVEQKSAGRFTIIRSPEQLRAYLDRRRSDQNMTAGFLGIEGAQALDGKLENIDVLYAAGFRMMSPSHFFDTEFGGSSAGVDKIGLTDMGRAMVRRMEEKHMLVDLAHAAPKTIDDVLAMARRPVVVSHTGVKGTCDTVRNLSDDHVRGVARTGGLIGIAYFQFATCGKGASAIARAIKHTVDVAGIEHVALGSDFDGAIAVPFDTTGLPLIIDALLAAGFDEASIGKIMGGNAIQLLLNNL